jgi:hypothetical protein
MRKTTLLAFVPCALLVAGTLWAQAQDAGPESARQGASNCQYEDGTGSRIRQHVCRPRFKTDIATAAARQWRYGLISSCGGVTQECIFSDAAQQAMSMAQAEESREGLMQKRFTQEMARAVLESPQLRQAMLNYQAIERDYRESRKRRRD